MGILSKIKSVIMASTAAKIAAAAVAVVVLVGGIVGITYPAAFSSAESIVARAAMATFSGQTSAREEIFGLGELAAALKEQGAEISAETTIKELSLGDLGLGDMTLPNVGLSLVARATPQKEVSVVMDAKVANTTLLTGNAYLNQNQLQVNVPKLFDSVLTLNYNNAAIEEQMKNSYAAEYLGLTAEQIETIVDYLPKQTTPVSKEEIGKKLLEILVSNYDFKLGDTKLKKAGKEELQGKDTVQKCKVYSAELDGREVGAFLDLSHYTIKEYIKEISAGYHITEQQVEEAFGDAGTLMYQIKGWLRGPVLVKFYVWEERIVKISADWTMEVSTKEGLTTEPGSLVINFAPEGNPVENMYLAIHTPVHQDITVTNVPQRIDFIYQAATENTEDVYNVTYDAKYNGQAFAFDFGYEKLGGDFTLKAAGPEESITLTGAIELEKGNSIGLELDEYTYVEGDYVEEQEMNVTVSLQALEAEVTPLSGKQQDVLAMTEKDFTSLEKEITTNITWMLFSMMGLFQ